MRIVRSEFIDEAAATPLPRDAGLRYGELPGSAPGGVGFGRIVPRA